eukprot:symbB.v1.2.019346.t1/scaffold1578.1/size215304/7
MQSTAGSALQSLMSKGGKSPASPSSLASPGHSGQTPKAADQKTVVSSATQLKSTSKAGALLNNLVTPKTKAAAVNGTEEPVKPTHSDRAREQAEAKIPLLGHDPSIGMPGQASPHRATGQSSRCDGSRILKVVGAICILAILGAVAAVALLVKPQATSHDHLRHHHLHKESKVEAGDKAHSTTSSAPTTHVTTSALMAATTTEVESHRTTSTKREKQETSRRSPSIEEQHAALAQALHPFMRSSEAHSEYVAHFDCGDTQGLRLNQWSAAHIKYCCLTDKIGCDVVPPIDCTDPEALSDWSSWSDSCDTCGGGQRSRHRRFRFAYKQCESAPERRSIGFVDREACQDVTMDDFVSSWSAWGHCSVTCGSGDRTRVRAMTQLATKCKLEFPLEERKTCERPRCVHTTTEVTTTKKE